VAELQEAVALVQMQQQTPAAVQVVQVTALQETAVQELLS
jgi:hypothetical protein